MPLFNCLDCSKDVSSLVASSSHTYAIVMVSNGFIKQIWEKKARGVAWNVKAIRCRAHFHCCSTASPAQGNPARMAFSCRPLNKRADNFSWTFDGKPSTYSEGRFQHLLTDHHMNEWGELAGSCWTFILLMNITACSKSLLCKKNGKHPVRNKE